MLDLGYDPGHCIRYYDGNGFSFHPWVEAMLDKLGARYSQDDLERIFLPFLRYRLRLIVERSHNFHKPSKVSGACPYEELPRYQQDLHSFDKRRLHYLRFGRIDIGTLDGRPWKFLNVLSCKSRDEIESVIEDMERKLPRSETIAYIYTALNLQAYFPFHLLRNYPVGLDRERLDEYFLREICGINQTPGFFAGLSDYDPETLHPILRKYVILYFDSPFEASGSSPMEDYIRMFIWRRRFYRQAPSLVRMEVVEAYRIMSITAEQFARMSRAELTRRYRRRAMKEHPDRGGDHDEFVKLNEAYELLMSRK
ncbi:MAG: J domain-containing protein [Acidobacteriota bacterium]